MASYSIENRINVQQQRYHPIQTSDKQDILQCLHDHIGFFKTIPMNDLDSFLDQAKIQFFEKDDVVFHRGDPGDHFYVILNGVIGAFASHEDGRHAMLGAVGRGHFFGELSLLEKRKRVADAVALTSTKLLVIPRENFIALVKNNPQSQMELINNLVECIHELYAKFDGCFFQTLDTRVARLIMELSHYTQTYLADERQNTDIRVNITQQELADMLASTRESVNKTLNQMKQDGLIDLERGYIRVLNADGLKIVAKRPDRA